MILEQFVFPIGPLEANVFLAANEATRDAFFVDAGACDDSVAEAVRAAGVRPVALLVTHHHHDHVSGAPDFLARWPDLGIFSPAPHPLLPGATLLEEGDRVLVAGFEFEVFRTSGHTPESISYYCAAERLAFVGDAIFAGAVGGTPNDELHAEELGHLRRTILRLPPETELYSGHGPVTTVGIETAANPFLRPGFGRVPPSRPS